MNLAPENVCGNRQASPDSTSGEDYAQRCFHRTHCELTRIARLCSSQGEQTENCLSGEEAGNHWNASSDRQSIAGDPQTGTQ